MSQQRLDKLRHKMEAQGMEAMLVSKRENIRYLSGFTAGSDALLLISLQDQYILTDSRYTEQAGRECPNWELILEKPPDRKALQHFHLLMGLSHFTLDTDYSQSSSSHNTGYYKYG
jgi:Xaa-Pro aminopeptidase